MPSNRYSQEIQDEAFVVWHRLRNDPQTVDELRQKYPEQCATLNKETLRRWRNKYQWAERALAIDNKVREELDKDLVGRRKQWITDLQTYYKQLDSIRKGTMKPRSFEGALNAQMSIINKLSELTGHKDLMNIKVDNIVLAIFQVLAEDNVLGKQIVQRSDLILERIQKAVMREHGKKAIVVNNGGR